MKTDKKGFTLVELLTVIAILAILSSFLLVGLAKARERARRVQCMNNIKQVATALDMFANSNKDHYPLATGQHDWGDTPLKGWMEQVFDYIKNKQAYKCPSFPKNISDYHYFMSGRAAYLNAEPDGFASTFREQVKYPSSFVIAGDTNYKFAEPDCDKDDYTQNCLGWAAGVDYREPLHGGGLNVAFMDTHVLWFNKYDSEKMTFRYKEMSDWE